MKIYLDVCCLNRPFNDQRDPRIRLESEAVLFILQRIDSGTWTHVTSEMAQIEIGSIKQPELRKRILSMLPPTDSIMHLDEPTLLRAQVLEALGLKGADAVHVAAAESLAADVFLTCDDRLMKAAARHAKDIRVRVVGPLAWVKEYEKGQDTR